MLRILWRIVKYALRHKVLITVTYTAMAGSIVALLIIPRLVGGAIDTALESGSRTELLLQAGAIVAMAAVQGVLRYIDEYTAEIVVQRVGREIRTDIFQKLQSLSYGFHDRQRTGDLMARATADVDSVRVFPIWGLGEFAFMAILVGAASILMLTMNLALGLATMGFMAFVILRSAAEVPVMVGLHSRDRRRSAARRRWCRRPSPASGWSRPSAVRRWSEPSSMSPPPMPGATAPRRRRSPRSASP